MKLHRLDGPLPAWLQALDGMVFGEAWGEPAAHEALWTLEGVAFARWSLVPAAGEAELLRIAVDPSHRGKGVAKELLMACEAELATSGLRALHLEVRVSNAAARALYASAGWEAVGLRKGYYRDGEDAALYGKRIG